ncbi:hypothetical protein [Desulfomonile tiedjei]|uniref:Uncharacterized protein n=1 Tax=Desulfomonile tiedjei (strain ATCC 49306 / DSM 6799 / DCB-1) TaxID=706587 RepID=I4C1K0_DESTA|nr:hypothetical protein [Desulfomonile tiedjei]AFM23441.1 hypothetical protein Desti_0715 [Desulfomonile tiedjei DSM 6799]
MSAKTDKSQKKLVIQTMLLGAVTAILYAAVFSHANTVVELFARGGYYAVFPIATVFVFSFAHGAFASNLWSALGIEAVTKQAVKRPAVSAPRATKRERPRLRMSV